ncbi:DUF5688 family protein [Sellimonas intestinalis]|uniref:DUF5688 family protein n=1 Tax=Sellimonas intestinalis TaxID=1653434 RepID=UPI0015EC06DF|nr:DUF5688 family protein [Sellimonas intestinalis]MBA2214173.1 hypothetical protein [Sellimonas intestinalis]
MTYEEFAQEIYRNIKKTLKGEYSVKMEELLKCNDCRKKQLIMERKGRGGKVTAKPSVGLESFYEQYRSGGSVSECVRAILQLLKEAEEQAEAEQWCGILETWESAKTRVYPILLSQSRNQELLQELVWTPFLDLAVCYVVMISMENGQGNVKIRNTHLATWGISEEELIAQAKKNNLEQGYSLKRLDELARNTLMGEETANVNTIEEGEMFVLTNKDICYGAAKLLCEPALKTLSGGRDFYILPSSLHEVILLPEVSKVEKEDLNRMIREVNKTMVAEDDILSDHAYFYCAKNGRVEL